MGLGSDSQSQAQLTSSIQFNPSNIIGSSNDTSPKSTSTQTPEQRADLKSDAAVSLGLGGSGGAVGLASSVADGAKSVVKDLPFGLTPLQGLGLMTATFGAYMVYKNYKPKKKKKKS